MTTVLEMKVLPCCLRDYITAHHLLSYTFRETSQSRYAALLIVHDYKTKFCPLQSSGKRDQTIHTLIQLINHTACPLEVLHLAGGPNSRLRESIVPFISALGSNNRITEIDVSGHGFGNKVRVPLTNSKALPVNTLIKTCRELLLWHERWRSTTFLKK